MPHHSPATASSTPRHKTIRLVAWQAFQTGDGLPPERCRTILQAQRNLKMPHNQGKPAEVCTLRRRRILRSVRGLACMLVSLLIISFTMSRCHDADSNPYFEGSMRVHSVIFLRTSGPRIFFRPVGFLSNLPSRPLCYSDQPITNCRIRPHQFVRYGPYPLAVLALAAGNPDVPGLAGRCRFDHAANIFPAGTGKKSISLENLCSVANRRA